jgi:mRNA-degrading endonuclease RelE of RelBE toxin-antitoxin system
VSFNIFYTPEFKRNIRKLLKKYPSLPRDIDGFIQQLQQGDLIGSLLQYTGYQVYKARIKNSDNQKGKSAGYRVIYYLKTDDEIILMTLYSKSEQGDVSSKFIRNLIDDWNRRLG